MAWLLVVFLVPYLGVPLYIVFGGRKMRKNINAKGHLANIEPQSADKNGEDERKHPSGISNLFPLRRVKSLTLLATGEEAFGELMKHLESAQHSIFITTFILGKDPTGEAILKTLARKAKQGVNVCLLLDALGSFGISSQFLAEFKQAGGKHAFFMPMVHWPFRGRANLRNHRKMVIVDGRIAMLGGLNLANEYMGPSVDSNRWRDLSVLVTGPILDDIYTIFRADWKFAAKEELPAPARPNVDSKADGEINLQLVPSGPDVKEDSLYDAVLSSLFSVKKRIWVITPYFIPDETLTRALCIAARRNLDVRIIVPQSSNHRLADLIRRSYLRQIQASGGKVYTFQPGMLHAKLIILDDTLGIIGSMNMDMRSFFLNYEVAMFIHSEPFVRQLEAWSNNIVRECGIGVKKASAPVGYLEDIGRLFAPLL
jgi:cardiolipin synthase